MNLRKIIWALLLLSSFQFTFAGDVADYVNLGFSSNGDYFMFGQYGVEEDKKLPYADVYTVDVAKNVFVTGGVFNYTGSSPAEIGQDGSGALYTLIEKAISLRKKYGIEYLTNGRLLYLLVNGAEEIDSLEFRDFVTGATYNVSLFESISGSGTSAQSAFHIKLTVKEKNGNIQKYTIGHPSYKRKGVTDYTIKQVVLAPNGKSLIFVIQKKVAAKVGSNIRFMVESVSLK